MRLLPVRLPNGETISVPVGYADDYAFCIKESGDDPDVTNGIEIRANLLPASPGEGDKPVAAVAVSGLSISVYAGEGIGRFTLPGFDYPPGEPAVNRGPREMLRQNLQILLDSYTPADLPPEHQEISILLSIPTGADIARRTFNPRLGIEGGISVIGVSGIVRPFSEEAFIESIRKCMQVAKASGTERVVIGSGAKSEDTLRTRYPELPQQAFVQYGNYIGQTLRMAEELGIPNITLGIMLGKAVKLAAGHLDTHSRRAVMDKDFVAQLLQEASCATGHPSADCAIDLHDITLARELWDRLPASLLPSFVQTVIAHCHSVCSPLLPHSHLTILLIDDDGIIHT